jgi:hypothetical protein
VRFGWPRISESVPVRGTRCFSIPNCPDRFWSASVSLSKGNGAVFLRVKLPWRVNGHSVLSTLNDKNDSKYTIYNTRTSIFLLAFLSCRNKTLSLNTCPFSYVSECRNSSNTEIATII